MGTEYRQRRQGGNQSGKHVDELVVRAEQHRRTQDRCLGECGQDGCFARRLGLRISRGGCRVGTQRRNMHEGRSTRSARSCSDPTSACALQRIEIASKGTDKIDHCVSPGQRPAEALRIGHIAARELQLAKIT